MVPYKHREKSDIVVVLTAVFFSILIAVIALVFYGPRLSTNDDVLIKALLNGDISGSHETHIINGMFLFGAILKPLYEINGNVAWYDFLLFGLHIMVYLFLLIRVCQLTKGKKTGIRIVMIIISGLFITFLDFQYIILHQYTILATVMAAVGVFWLVTLREENRREKIADYSVIAVSVLLCLLMRIESFLMVLPVFALAFLYRMIRKANVSKVVFLLILAAAVSLVFIAEKSAYSTPEWKEFKKIHSERIDIYDYYRLPSYDLAKEDFEKLGIERTDLYPLGEWDLGLFEDYNANRMEPLSALCKKYWEKENELPLTQMWAIKYIIKKLIPKIFENPLWPAGWILFLGTPFLLVWLIIKKQYKKILFSVFSFLYMMVFSVYFIYRGRFPERVSYGLYFLIIAFLAGIFASGKEEGKKKNSPDENDDNKKCAWKKIAGRITLGVVSAVLIAGVGLRLYQTRNLLSEAKSKDADWDAMNEYFLDHPENMYYIKTTTFSANGEEMFKKSTYEKNNFVRLGAWFVKSPIHERYLAIRGDETWKRIRTDENVYYVEDETAGTDWIERFYEGRGISVDVTTADTVTLPSGRNILLISIREK